MICGLLVFFSLSLECLDYGLQLVGERKKKFGELCFTKFSSQK